MLPFQTRLFSLREAEALLPLLREKFARARELRDELTELQHALAAAGRPLPEAQDIEVEADAPEPVQALQSDAKGVVAELMELLRGVAELGIEIKAADGLVDFRSRLEGRVVYLCWKFGEERIAHYHELDSGFASRKALPAGKEFSGELLH